MEYNFRDIEKKWQQKWVENKVYQVPNNADKPKYYVLDMFPYPSGAGLHVGHPLGYIASDIYARYKRLKGFNVLHPMGYDAFGLPAEQYAIEHGIHPAVSTDRNIETFRKQLDNIGFSFDWSREIKTSDPKYYKWTQWIFLQLFKSWYNRQTNKTEHIDSLVSLFEKEGNQNHPIPDSQFVIPCCNKAFFSAEEWKAFDEYNKHLVLMEYRIAYCGIGEVNWCEALGTVLANDEVVNGVSERGGYPVVKKKLRQWYLRITEYADRFLEGLNKVEFSEAMKEMQSNWIGKSEGAELEFGLTPSLSINGEGEQAQDSALRASVPKYKVLSAKQFENARLLRKASTEAENVLWQHLRNSQLGVKFRRQHPIDSFIADFVSLQDKLIVEIDGGYHNTLDQTLADEERTLVLSDIGFKVIRFKNEEVLFKVEEVINKIKSELSQPVGNTVAKAFLSIHGERQRVRCFTTRPDTIFGVDFMVLAPEHELVQEITTLEQMKAVEEYIAYVNSRSDRERMAEKKISGVFTGAYVEHPFTEKPIPVWISEYVLAGYGTGAIMAVPSGDERDHKFAQHFNIPITNIFGDAYNGEEAITAKDAVLQNSDFLNGLTYKNALPIVLDKLEQMRIGKRKVNYKIRDAAFSRQRYWGEPFPIVWKNGIAYPLDEKELPLELPYVESYKPGPEGEGPLANIPEWVHQRVKVNFLESSKVSPTGRDLEGARETNTMPGYAGSSWYFLRYMDPHNDEIFCDKQISNYWNQVDLYVGGTEHAVGHLLYSRMWTKALYDLGYISFDEPFKKLLNQGMIQGSSRFVYRIHGTNKYVSYGLKNQYEVDEIHVDVNIVDGVELDIEAFRKWREEYADAKFILEDGSVSSSDKIEYADFINSNSERAEGLSNLLSISGEGQGARYICGTLTEKMSKRLYNTVNPDTVVEKYGADTFRMYEMFLGPVEMSKPWDTKGIEGVHRFLKKLWRLFINENGITVSDEEPNNAEYKILNKTIKKIEEDTERFSFNTAVSAFMVCVNELTDLKCNKKKILAPLLVLLTPYAPHVAEELWHQLGNTSSILDANFPKLEEKYLVESSKEYPISVNGKLRTQINIDLNASKEQVEEIVMANPVIQKWVEGKTIKKLIYVPGKMVNLVV
jgi:leucyl-tRNA synthetase